MWHGVKLLADNETTNSKFVYWWCLVYVYKYASALQYCNAYNQVNSIAYNPIMVVHIPVIVFNW